MRAMLLATGLCVLVGCTSVPRLEDATRGIPLHDIVIRVKCELADSFSERLDSPNFAWMARWTVKVDLTLLANNQAAVVPSATFTEFHKSAVNPITKQNVQQFFTFGASASFSETATRTELISFSLSLRELAAWKKDEKNYGDLCNPGRNRELTGNLGLKEWLDSALAPVQGPKADLQAGDHPTPPSSSKGGDKKGGAAFKEDDFPEDAGSVAAYIEIVKNLAKKLATEADKVEEESKARASILSANPSYLAARKRFKAYRAKWYDVSAPQYKQAMEKWDATYAPSRLIAQAVSELRKESKAMSKVIEKFAKIQRDKDLKTDDQQITKAGLIYKNSVLKKKDDFEKWMNIEISNWDRVKFKDPDPPIDSISHSVQFVVAYSAGVSPVWTLLQWKGPAGSSPLLSAGGGRTHTMNMTLGSSTAEQTRALSTLAIQQITLPR